MKALALALLACIAFAVRAEPAAVNVARAENSIQTSNDRLFVSSDGALYELGLEPVAWRMTPVPVQYREGKPRACYFLGIAESAGTLYTVCTENALDPRARKYLFGLDIHRPAPQLMEIGELKGVAMPNGLAADDAGHLYLADSGAPQRPGAIRKITLARPFEIASQITMRRFASGKPNGLRYAKGKLYVSVNPITPVGMAQLLRYDIAGNRLIRQKNIYNSLDFLDDFALVDGGLVLAHVIGGSLVHVDEQGSELRRARFSQPTSVSLLTSPRYGAGNLLVTERGSGQVHRFVNDWGLRPREARALADAGDSTMLQSSGQ